MERMRNLDIMWGLNIINFLLVSDDKGKFEFWSAEENVICPGWRVIASE